MAERCPHSPLRGTGWLLGWRITFGGEGWDGALPTWPRRPSPGLRRALRRDDGRRGRPGRVGERATPGSTARSGSGWPRWTASRPAWVYVLDDFEGGMPSARTLGILADAAEAAGAPERLRRRAARPALLQRLVTAGASGMVIVRPCPTVPRPRRPIRTRWPSRAAAALRERFGIAGLDSAFVLGSGWSAAADDLGELIGSCELAELPGFAKPTVRRSRRCAADRADHARARSPRSSPAAPTSTRVAGCSRSCTASGPRPPRAPRSSC